MINTKEGDNAELYCNFETNPSGTIKWSKDGDELPVSPAFNSRSKYLLKMLYENPSSQQQNSAQKNASVLIVSNVQTSDLGYYDCQVQNQIGTENVTIELTYAPEPPHLQDVQPENNGDIITVWHVRSLQELTEIKIIYEQDGVRKCNLVLIELVFILIPHFLLFSESETY